MPILSARFLGLSLCASYRELPSRMHAAFRSLFAAAVLTLMVWLSASVAFGQMPSSDEFNETTLNTGLWQVRAPAGGTAALSNGELVISVPPGSNHQPLPNGLNLVRVIQPVSNADFDLAIKLDAQLTRSALETFQGLLIGGDGGDYIYYQVYSDGTNVDLQCTSVDSGATHIQINTVPFSAYAVPTYLRLQRSGTTYTAYWSADGSTWNTAGTFSDGLVATHVGPFAGNYNSNAADAPTFTASFDWFHNLATSGVPTVATPTFTPASGTNFSSTLSVSIADTTPNATIYYTTNGSTPTTSSQVYSGPFTISATTTANAIATSSGDTQSALATANYSLQSQPTVAKPTFNPVSGTSFSSTLSVSIADSTPNATIYYTIDGSTPTTSSQVYSGPFSIDAAVTVNAIATATSDTPSALATANYPYMPVTGGGPTSDEFNETSLNTALWQVRAPAGGSATVSGGELVISVPGGSNHDAFVPALDAVQVVQPISNENFDVAVKIDSTLQAASQYYGQGLMVEGDAKDYVRFEVSAGGSISLAVSTIIAGSQSTKVQIAPFTSYSVPTYLRLTRVGATYTAYWSTDGVTWNKVGSFTDSLVVTGLAPYAWNYSATPSAAPALTASFDWFHNLATSGPATVATPTFTPASGTSFSSTLSVSIADTTPDATLYYTTDGSTPTTSSHVYSAPFTISATTTVHAIATTSGETQSALATATYAHQSTQATATPTFNPASGTSFSSTLSVSIADATSNATIYYTTDGSTPTTASQVYSAPFTISATTTIHAIAIASGDTQSALATANYSYVQASGGPVSDEFNESSLNTGLWQLRAPGGGSAVVSGGELVITVPGGSNHDAFVPALDAVQVVQPISNENFDVAVKIDSALQATSRYYGQGLMVEGDAKDYIRFEVSAGGSISLAASTIIAGSQSTKVQIAPFTPYSVPTYLRLTRVGTTYMAYWSTDGVNWSEAGSFTDSLVVSGLAPYAWNYSATPSAAPALTASFDWFHNLSSTVAPPTFTPASGARFSSPLAVTIEDGTPGATIYYTTDGSTPTTGSTVYSGPITLSASTTVEAIATADTYTPSAVASASYFYNPQVSGPSFTLSVEPVSLALSPGLSQTITLSANAVDGFSGTVAISLENIPAGISASPESVNLTPGSAKQIIFSASPSFTTSATATLNGTAGPLSQSQPIAFSALGASPSSIVSNGLIAYFPLDEGAGSTISDVSSNKYTGAFGGSGNGWVAGGVTLNGNGRIDLPNALNSAQTIQMWVNIPATNPNAGQALIGSSGACCKGVTDWQIQPVQTGQSMQQLAGFAYDAFGALSNTPFTGSATLTFAMGSSAAKTLDQYWINGTQVFYEQAPVNTSGITTGASAGSQTSGHYQIGSVAGTVNLTGTIGPVAFYNRQLTASEIAANAAYFNQLEQSRGVQTQLGNSVAQNQFAAMGDSITYGYPQPGGPYCQYLTFSSPYSIHCLGVGGQVSSFGLSEAAQLAQYYAEAAPKNVMMVWFGTNDISYGTPVSQIFSNLLSTCQTIKQVYPGWKVLLATMMSRYYNNLDYDPYKNSLNALIRGGSTPQCDGYIDMAADPNLGADGDYANTKYFVDEIHPTQLGYQQIATMISSYVNSLDGYTISNPNRQSAATYKMSSPDNYMVAAVNGAGSWTLPECQGLTGKVYQINNTGSGLLTVSGANSEAIIGSEEIEPGATASFQINLISASAAGCNWTRTQ
jgi:lysophospholipase L1-like esterase